MQLLNGLNMGMLKFYRLNFNNPERSTSGENTEDQNENFKKIEDNINLLKDTSNENGATAKETLNNLISADFLSGFINSLNENQKNSLKSTVKSLLDAHKNEGNFQSDYKGLIDLAKALEVEGYEGTEELDGKHGINGDINNESVQSLENGQATTGKFYENGKRVETAPEWVNTVGETINDQLGKLASLLGENSSYKDNEGLKKASRLLENIQKIIENPIESNVQLLQQYIFDNLDDNMLDENNGDFKKTFKKKNKYNESTKQFDGKFGETTLAGLNKVLEKIGKYIDSFKDQPSEGSEDEPFMNVKLKDSINLPGGDIQINATDLLDDLPEGATAEFKDNAGIDKSKTDEQEVTVIVKIGDKIKEITVIATVDATNNKIDLRIKEAGNPATTEATTIPLDTTPYEDNQGKKYQVMKNSQTIAVRANLRGVTFYTTEAFTGTEPRNGEQWQVFETPNNGDYECLMKKGDSIYRVKVDQNGNICPTAVNMVSNVPVVMENSASGKAYIENKLPPILRDRGITIGWNGEDYTISLPGGGKILTIEPMTIDGKRIGNLTDSLAFLNLTNYLRNSGKINDIEFKNDNPDLKLEGNDLYVRVKKTRDLNGKKIKWLKVNKDTFGLSNDEKLLKKYISYNNGEDWDDNWDKKKPNKYYKPIKIQ